MGADPCGCEQLCAARGSIAPGTHGNSKATRVVMMDAIESASGCARRVSGGGRVPRGAHLHAHLHHDTLRRCGCQLQSARRARVVGSRAGLADTRHRGCSCLVGNRHW
jgi:hypothetical protein